MPAPAGQGQGASGSFRFGPPSLHPRKPALVSGDKSDSPLGAFLGGRRVADRQQGGRGGAGLPGVEDWLHRCPTRPSGVQQQPPAEGQHQEDGLCCPLTYGWLLCPLCGGLSPSPLPAPRTPRRNQTAQWSCSDISGAQHRIFLSRRGGVAWTAWRQQHG